MAEIPADINLTDTASSVIQDESTPPEIYQLPTRSLSWTFRLLFGLASITTGMIAGAIKQIVLPAQIALLVPDVATRNTTFAIIASVGGLAGLIASPLAGALSDRTTVRLGRRRPWVILGLVSGMFGLTLMAKSTSLLPLLLGEILVQISFDMIMSALTAILPDQVPVHQRAGVSTLIGMAPIVGGLVGAILVARFSDPTHNPWQGYLVMGIATCVVTLPFFIVLREQRLPRELVPTFTLKKFLGHFWVNPAKYPDFGLTWASRCLIFLSSGFLVSYLEFYLQDVIHYANPATGVAIFNICQIPVLIVAAIIGGLMADKLQSLKPFIIAGAILMALALFIIAFVQSWPVMLIAAVILGIGFGTYLSIDIALAVRVLPNAGDRGKDLGIINTAIFIPVAFGALIGSGILNFFGAHNAAAGYTTLFAFAAICVVVGALLLLPIKSVR